MRHPEWLADAEPRLRVPWYVHVSVLFWLDTFQQTAHNLRRDGRLFVLHYLSPRFHPWQHDNRDLPQMWLERNDGAYRAIASPPS